MSNLIHVTMKGPENSGHTWCEFYCPRCSDKKQAAATGLLFLKRVRAP